MDSSVSPKDEIWFLRVCHHISNGVYKQEPHGRGQYSVLLFLEHMNHFVLNYVQNMLAIIFKIPGKIQELSADKQHCSNIMMSLFLFTRFHMLSWIRK
jgi:hypothetical protein